jgi:hypothetical protein
MATAEEWTNFVGGNLPTDMAKVYIYKTELAEGEFLRKLAGECISGMILILNPNNDEVNEPIVLTNSQPHINAERWTLVKEFDNVSKLDLTMSDPVEEEIPPHEDPKPEGEGEAEGEA